eukprot:1154045-Pelagomonas_calceolata.AAC.7
MKCMPCVIVVNLWIAWQLNLDANDLAFACPSGAGLVDMDIGSDDWLAQHNLQIPAHAMQCTEQNYTP